MTLPILLPTATAPMLPAGAIPALALTTPGEVAVPPDFALALAALTLAPAPANGRPTVAAPGKPVPVTLPIPDKGNAVAALLPKHSEDRLAADPADQNAAEEDPAHDPALAWLIAPPVITPAPAVAPAPAAAPLTILVAADPVLADKPDAPVVADPLRDMTYAPVPPEPTPFTATVVAVTSKTPEPTPPAAVAAPRAPRGSARVLVTPAAAPADPTALAWAEAGDIKPAVAPVELPTPVAARETAVARPTRVDDAPIVAAGIDARTNPSDRPVPAAPETVAVALPSPSATAQPTPAAAPIAPAPIAPVTQARPVVTDPSAIVASVDPRLPVDRAPAQPVVAIPVAPDMPVMPEIGKSAAPGPVASATPGQTPLAAPAPAPAPAPALAPQAVAPTQPAPRSPEVIAVAPVAPAPAIPTVAPTAPPVAAPILPTSAQRVPLPFLSRFRPVDAPRLPESAASAFFAAALQSAAPSPLAAPAAEPVAQPQIDLKQELGLHRMIDRIEQLRDAADARDTRIRLVPDALGPVEISVKRDGDAVRVHFTAEQPQTRALIADAQPRLNELAEARGIRIAQSTVEAGPDEQGQPRQPTQQQSATPTAPRRARDESTDDAADARLA